MKGTDTAYRKVSPVHGFTHLQVNAELMTVRHLDDTGSLLHKFTKDPTGLVTILK